MPPSIVLIEPQMEGVHHAPFNAALLHATALAYPAAPLGFRADSGHVLAVREIIAEHAPAVLERVAWSDLQIPRGSMAARWLTGRRLLRSFVREDSRLLFCSISRLQLLLLKDALASRAAPVCAVLHGELEQIESPSTERFPKNLFGLERALALPHPPSLRYLLLSESIQASIPGRLRTAFTNSSVLDHPYHFRPFDPDEEPPPLSFGIFGNTGSAHQLEEVARRVKAQRPDVRFRVVGFVESAAADRLEGLIDNAPTAPIDRTSYLASGASLAYALWLANPGGFRLRASGTFFDALSFAKPLIYTANLFIDPYHALEPRLGVRCATLEDVAAAILERATPVLPASYAEDVGAILRFRERFTPQALAARLPAILGWS